MKLMLTFLLLSLVEWAAAQSDLHGRILDKDTQEPLEGISVFLSNTTKGSATDKKGEFVLDNVRSGKYELVITSVNYEDSILPVEVNEAIGSLTIKLTRKTTLLKEVIVESYDEDGWDKWGESLMSYLVGSPQRAKNCVLKNPDAVKFQFSSKSNRLRAFSNEKLIFDNSELGYRITYVLKNFEIDFNDGTFSFKGYPVFEELRARDKKEMAKWARLRSDIYQGSLRHFIRSLYFDRLSKDGFEIRRMKWVTAGEVRRVKSILRRMNDASDLAGNRDWSDDKDSIEYYQKVRNLAYNDSAVIFNDLVRADAILTAAAGQASKSLFFNGTLQVLYLHKRNPAEFGGTLPAYRKNELIRSDISLRYDNAVSLYPNGNYYNGLNLLIDGYWAWSEKIATMLPVDYIDSPPAGQARPVAH